MPRLSSARIISIIIFIYSVLVIVGWILNIPILLHVLPTQQPMAFVTAISFFLSAIALWFLEDAMKGNSETAILVLPATTLATLLLMTTVVAASILGAYTGITNLFLATTSVFTPVNPGMPAIMSVLGFVLFDASTIHAFFLDSDPMSKTVHLFEILIIAIGVVAIFGYIIGIPLLTYKFSAVSTPMALNTAITFIFLGSGILLAEKSKGKP